MYKVLFSPEFEAWFKELETKSQMAIAKNVKILQSEGFELGRPYADHIKGSKYGNMKELRTSQGNHVWRCLYIFDKERQAILLIGGDKKGKKQGKFYKRLIKLAESIYERYLSNGK